MSTHYLVSHFNDDINDVVTPTSVPASTLLTGNYIVRVPDDVPVQNPTDVSDLITKKYAGILGTYGLFTTIAFDDMLDGTGVDFTNSTGVTAGENGTVGIYPKNTVHIPVLQTTTETITGPAPTQTLLTYELFEVVDSDDKDTPYQRTYQEVTPDVDVLAQISFNNGVDFVSTLDKAVINIPGAAQGTDLVLRFTRQTDIGTRGRVFLGSWAVLF